MRKWIRKMLIAALVSTVAIGNAGTSTASFQTTATISSTCTVGANNIDFGAMQFGTRVWVSSSMNILCTNGTPYTIAINFGHVDATQPQDGDMVGSLHGDLIDYSITTTMNGSSKWGYTAPVTGTGTGATQNIPMYGVAITGLYGKPLYPSPDNYSDTATVVVTY